LREVRRIRIVFSSAQVDARKLRRKLRGKPAERRFTLVEPGILHRTDAAKLVFSRAEGFAQLGDGVVYPAHLLYAVLLHENKSWDSVLYELGVDKARLQEIAKAQ